MRTRMGYSTWSMDWETLVSTSDSQALGSLQLLKCILGYQWDRSLVDKYGPLAIYRPMTDLSCLDLRPLTSRMGDHMLR